jgi:hypothetical protein
VKGSGERSSHAAKAVTGRPIDFKYASTAPNASRSGSGFANRARSIS